MKPLFLKLYEVPKRDDYDPDNYYPTKEFITFINVNRIISIEGIHKSGKNEFTEIRVDDGNGSAYFKDLRSPEVIHSEIEKLTWNKTQR